jgi:hypothetical protein
MERIFFKKAIVCLFTVVALCSCNKDDDDFNSTVANNTITAKVENGSRLGVDEVSVKIWYETGSSWNVYEVVISDYNSGEFTLNLPSTVSDKYLSPDESLDDLSDDGVKVSNPGVKTGWAYFEAYDSGDNTGEFIYATGTSSSDWYGQLVYVNGDLSITGTYMATISTVTNGEITDTKDYPQKYSIHLKKGWNMLYEKDTDDNYERTTKAPAGLKWYYQSYSSSAKSVSAKKTPSLLSKSKIRLTN